MSQWWSVGFRVLFLLGGIHIQVVGSRYRQEWEWGEGRDPLLATFILAMFYNLISPLWKYKLGNDLSNTTDMLA